MNCRHCNTLIITNNSGYYVHANTHGFYCCHGFNQCQQESP
jgi:hypothetical protein